MTEEENTPGNGNPGVSPKLCDAYRKILTTKIDGIEETFTTKIDGVKTTIILGLSIIPQAPSGVLTG